MLSYKLKHLCSRVVASLSAVGLFSINTGSAKADGNIYMPKVAIKSYSVMDNTTLSAKMTKADWSDYCKAPASGNVSGLPGVTGVYGQVVTCELRCDSGWAFNVKDSDDNPITGITGVIYNPQTHEYQNADFAEYAEVAVQGCQLIISHDCPVLPNADSLNIDSNARAYFTTGTSNGGAYCTYMCKQGYHSPHVVVDDLCPDGSTTGCGAGETGNTGTVSYPTDSVNIEACVPNQYMNVYECTDGILTGEAGGMTGKFYQAVKYGEPFSIPNVWCEATGFVFNGWETDVDFEVGTGTSSQN